MKLHYYCLSVRHSKPETRTDEWTIELVPISTPGLGHLTFTTRVEDEASRFVPGKRYFASLSSA